MNEIAPSKLDDLYLPDGKRLNVMIWGQAGAGKSKFIETTLGAFAKKNRDEMWRAIYISPKQEGILGIEPLRDVYKLEKYLKKNRIAVVFPNVAYLDEEVDYIINLMFDMREANEDLKTTIMVDDAQVFLSARKAASPAHRRLALTGRSKMIKAVYVSHNVVFARELEGQISTLVGFSNPLPLYYRSSIERYGWDPEPYAAPIAERPYSFVWFDTKTRVSTLMAPLDIKSKR